MNKEPLNPRAGSLVTICALALTMAHGTLAGMVAASARQSLQQQGRKLYPRDDSGRATTFAAFKTSLSLAADRGDLDAIRDAMALTVSLDFEDLSREDVLKALMLRRGSPWRALRTALRLGTVAQEVDGEREFIAPYVSAGAADIGPEELAITGSNVNVRRMPDANAPIVGHLSYDVVSTGPANSLELDVFDDNDVATGPTAWAQIVLPSGGIGYVHGRFVRSPLATRFRFKQMNGQWKMVSIARGD